MKVGAKAEGKVAAVLFAVPRLLHRTQTNHIHQRRLRSTFRTLEGAVNLCRAQCTGARWVEQTKTREHFLEYLQLAVLGRFMNAIDPAHSVFQQRLRNRLVGDQHRFFNRAMRLGPVARHDTRRPTVFTDLDLAFGNRKVDRAVFEAALRETSLGRRKQANLSDNFRGDAFGRVLFLGHDRARLLVRQPGVRLDHRGINTRALHPTVVPDQHFCDHDKAINAFAQRAQIGGNAFGQHRDDAVGEIHAVPAPFGFAIEFRPFAHVERDVRDCHIEPEPTIRLFNANRIVVIPGCGGVDGQKWPGTQVDATAKLLGV